MFIEKIDIKLEDFSKFFESRGLNGKCPLCGKEEWSIGGELFQLNAYRGGKAKLLGPYPIIPIIPISCGNCGNMILFNATKTGLVPETNKTNENAPKE